MANKKLSKAYRVVVPSDEKYTKDGVEKTRWNEVGRLVEFLTPDGFSDGFILQLGMFPSVKFKVFPIEAKTPQVEGE